MSFKLEITVSLPLVLDAQKNLLRSERYRNVASSEPNIFFLHLLIGHGAWGSVVVKTLRYWSDGPGIDSRWSHWIFQ